MKSKKRNELHPTGEGMFQIVKLIKKENGCTLIFSPLLKGMAPIPRTFYYFKKPDLEELQDYGCDTTEKKTIEQYFEMLKGKIANAVVATARNEKYRNIESFQIIETLYMGQK